MSEHLNAYVLRYLISGSLVPSDFGSELGGKLLGEINMKACMCIFAQNKINYSQRYLIVFV